MHIYTQPIHIDQKLASPFGCHDILIRVLYNKRLDHLELEEDESASEAFYHALSLCRWWSEDKGSLGKAMSVIAILHNIGYIQYHGSRHEQAMRTFEEALQLSCQVYKPAQFGGHRHHELPRYSSLSHAQGCDRGCIGLLPSVSFYSTGNLGK